jgi:ketosteroid isomerase-like protein
MSQENVEIAREGIDAFNAFMRGDLTNEEAADIADPQIEWHWHARRTFPDARQHLRGIPEMIGFWEQYRSAWADVVVEPGEFIEAPNDRVLIPSHQTARGRESGVPIEYHYFQLSTIRDGKVRKVEIFRHHAEALEAAGLSE